MREGEMKYETTYGERSPDAAPLVRAHPGHDGIREGRKRGVQIALFFQLGNSGMSGTASIRRVRFASRLNAEYRKRLFLIAKQIDIRQSALACNKAEISGLLFHNRQNPGL